MRPLLPLLAFALLAVPVQASMLEDLCGLLLPGAVCHRQRDFGAPGDAPADCPEALLDPRQLVVNPMLVQDALLLPFDDEADSVRLPIAPGQLKMGIVVTLQPSAQGDALFGAYHLQGFTPGCLQELPGSNNQIHFVPQEARDHVFRVTLRAPLARAAEPSAEACDPFCAVVNPMFGYGLNVAPAS